MNRLYSIAAISTPLSIFINIETWRSQVTAINLILAIIVSIVSLVSLIFIIRKNIFAARLTKLRTEQERYEFEHNKKMNSNV